LEGTFTGPLELNSKYKFNNTGWGSNAFIALYEDLTATDVAGRPGDKNPVKVYPNPTDSWQTVTFELHRKQEVQFQIIDLHNKNIFVSDTVVFDLGMQSYELNLNQVPNGYYFLRIISDELNQTLPILRK
ncbi:MAG: T9SS type A sorting domain-containing protein, partial [Flavobacteriales bacterium]|nr:T9SS type A sorting domain-containing protein [Flavobacteriales bacterium]